MTPNSTIAMINIELQGLQAEFYNMIPSIPVQLLDLPLVNTINNFTMTVRPTLGSIDLVFMSDRSGIVVFALTN